MRLNFQWIDKSFKARSLWRLLPSCDAEIRKGKPMKRKESSRGIISDVLIEFSVELALPSFQIASTNREIHDCGSSYVHEKREDHDK